LQKVNYASSKRGLRRLKNLLSDKKTRIEITKEGATPLHRSGQLFSPIGKGPVKVYAKRLRKGKANRPSRILSIRQAGNLRDAHDIVPTAFGVRTGPRVKPGSGNVAVYAPKIHFRNPWLRRAIQRNGRNSQEIMKRKIKRLINQANK